MARPALTVVLTTTLTLKARRDQVNLAKSNKIELLVPKPGSVPTRVTYHGLALSSFILYAPHATRHISGVPRSTLAKNPFAINRGDFKIPDDFYIAGMWPLDANNVCSTAEPFPKIFDCIRDALLNKVKKRVVNAPGNVDRLLMWMKAFKVLGMDDIVYQIERLLIGTLQNRMLDINEVMGMWLYWQDTRDAHGRIPGFESDQVMYAFSENMRRQTMAAWKRAPLRHEAALEKFEGFKDEQQGFEHFLYEPGLETHVNILARAPEVGKGKEVVKEWVEKNRECFGKVPKVVLPVIEEIQQGEKLVTEDVVRYNKSWGFQLTIKDGEHSWTEFRD